MLRRFRHYGKPLGRTATSALQSAMPCPPAPAAPSSGRGGAAGGAQQEFGLPNAHQSASLGGSRLRRRCQIRLGMPGLSGVKIGTVYQPGSEDVKGTVVAGVHLGRPGFQGY